MRLLLIEDEDGIGTFITQGLREAGHMVDWTRDGETGLGRALHQEYAVVVLDLMLPRMDGMQVLSRLRRSGAKVPILVLTARNTLDDRVRGLNLGADDYLTKPFEFPELVARIHALTRRPPLQLPTILRIADLEIDTERHTARRNGVDLDLSLREYMLLEYLAQNAGQALTRTQIGERVWGAEYFDESNVVDVYIGYLRRKVDRNTPFPLIRTLRGIGYCFGPDEHAE